MKVIINSPSLNPDENVSGISSVVQFIIDNNRDVEYIHFEIGRKDTETIIKAITTLYNDTKLRATLSKNAQETIFHKFDDKKYIDKLNKIYQIL